MAGRSKPDFPLSWEEGRKLALEEAKAAEVRILGCRCRVFSDGVELGASVPTEVG